MATKRRRGAAKRTYAKQEAARKRSAPGKRFVGETAAQSADDRRRQRKKVARMAAASRRASPAAAARTARKQPSRRTPPPPAEAPPPPESGQSDAAFRAAEERAALAGAEVEPLERPLASVSRLAPKAEDRQPLQPDGGAIAVGAEGEPWEEPAADVSAERGADRPVEAAPPLGWALTDLVRSAFGLARAVVSVPFRIALAIPRFALRAVMHG